MEKSETGERAGGKFLCVLSYEPDSMDQDGTMYGQISAYRLPSNEMVYWRRIVYDATRANRLRIKRVITSCDLFGTSVNYNSENDCGDSTCVRGSYTCDLVDRTTFGGYNKTLHARQNTGPGLWSRAARIKHGMNTTGVVVKGYYTKYTYSIMVSCMIAMRGVDECCKVELIAPLPMSIHEAWKNVCHIVEGRKNFESVYKDIVPKVKDLICFTDRDHMEPVSSDSMFRMLGLMDVRTGITSLTAKAIPLSLSDHLLDLAGLFERYMKKPDNAVSEYSVICLCEGVLVAGRYSESPVGSPSVFDVLAVRISEGDLKLPTSKPLNTDIVNCCRFAHTGEFKSMLPAIAYCKRTGRLAAVPPLCRSVSEVGAPGRKVETVTERLFVFERFVWTGTGTVLDGRVVLNWATVDTYECSVSKFGGYGPKYELRDLFLMEDVVLAVSCMMDDESKCVANCVLYKRGEYDMWMIPERVVQFDAAFMDEVRLKRMESDIGRNTYAPTVSLPALKVDKRTGKLV